MEVDCVGGGGAVEEVRDVRFDVPWVLDCERVCVVDLCAEMIVLEEVEVFVGVNGWSGMNGVGIGGWGRLSSARTTTCGQPSGVLNIGQTLLVDRESSSLRSCSTMSWLYWFGG